MNWLAHVFLSEQKIDFQIGNFLADPLKGRLWDDASSDMKNGMRITDEQKRNWKVKGRKHLRMHP